MSANPLETILHPRSVVVVGASPDPSKMGTLQAMNLVAGGFPGDVYFIHPKHRQILGRPACAAPGDLPEVPDVALLVAPARVSVELLAGLGDRGVRHAVISAGGFGEVGGDGPELAAQLKATAHRYGIRFVGPNCMGVLNTHGSVNLTLAPKVTLPGPLSLVSQSGTFVAQTQFLFRERGMRLSKAVSIGNAYSIDMVDCLEYLADDPDTSAIALYIEGLERPRAFLEVARRLTRHKPIVALYIGGTDAGARAGRSHTAALGGHDRLYDGIFEQAGILRASTVDELFSWGWGLAAMPLPKGRRVAILTHSGGPAASMADECERRGLEVPAFSDELQAALRPHVPPTGSTGNPVDLTFTMEVQALTRKLPEVLFASDEVDAVLIHGLMDTGVAGAFADVVARFLPVKREQLIDAVRLDVSRLLELPSETGKPLVGSTFVWDDDATRAQLAGGVPLTDCPQAAARILAALVRAADVMGRTETQTAEPVAPVDLPELAGLAPVGVDRGVVGGKAPCSVVLDEHDSKRILARYGIPLPDEEVCEGLADALAAADAFGYPVVLKGLVRDLAHKTEAGLVRLGLGGPDDLAIAWAEIERAAPGCPRLLMPMLRGGRELAVGMARRDGFGPTVMLGQGGVLAEAIDDATFRLAPLAAGDAERMLDSLRGRALYGAVRGWPAVDREALADLLGALSRLAVEHEEIAEVDLNPLIIVDGRPVVADAMVRVVRPGVVGRGAHS